MKKLVLSTILMLFLIGTAGCSKEEIIITAEDISVNTMFAKPNGVLQVATVEDFNKSYYNLTELNEFVKNEIDLFNQKAGGEKITIDDIAIKNGMAIMLLSFTGMDQYTAFNNVVAAYFNGGIKDNPLDMPKTLLSTKGKVVTNSDEVLQNDKYKVLVMNEPYDIIVDGSIKYYSDNAILVDDNKIQSSKEGMTVIVYKP